MWLKRLSILAVFLACGVVALGAYTRLADAGLGCPDWPGCYGHLTVPKHPEDIERANSAYPHRPVESHKAWPEMIHRYFASSLGLVILVMLYLSFRARRSNPATPIKLPLALAALVIFQGLLGMWTVTLGLFPTVVMAHLLGGFTTLCLLFILALRLHRVPPPPTPQPRRLPFRLALVAILVLGLQIALGGWTAANYAATICTELPICQQGWQEHINLQDAFQFWGHGLEDYEFATHLGPDAKITIHVAHRIGAVITTVFVGGLLGWLRLRPDSPPVTRRAAGVGLLILLLQVALGVSNVVFELPLLVAVAHNGVAAILMMAMIFVSLSLYRGGGRTT